MALNKFMHPRNIYKNAPDFSKMAKTYKEFSDISKVDIAGKVSIDFKDPQALRVLTKYLLKSDFNLDVVIPEDRLVPTLPLRLNYLLWIEDLLTVDDKNECVWGIDIGTGACAIYPLLAAVKNKWHMVGTETDEESLQKAKENVERNNLQNLVELKKNMTASIFECIFLEGNEKVFKFSMCNPPFYTNLQELWESRSPARPAPKNGFTGSPHELITEGGELQFCRKIIEESKIYKNKILIFTTMVGHKYNLKELVMGLKVENIKHTTTEFCQGRVTRWGLAWTYQDYDFSKLVFHKDISKKKNTPIKYTLPDSSPSDIDLNGCLEKVKTILNKLNIIFKFINKRKNEVTLSIAAYNNTWSNQRRKRRLLKRMEECQIKKPKLELQNDIIEESNTVQVSVEEEKRVTVEDKTQVTAKKNISTINNLVKDDKEIVVHGMMRLLRKDNNLNFELQYLNGTAGKEGLHQILQYIKNNWN